MRKQIQEKFGRLSNKVKPHEFWFIYEELTGFGSSMKSLQVTVQRDLKGDRPTSEGVYRCGGLGHNS